MSRSGGFSFVKALGRIGLWFSSLLAAIFLFSLLCTLIFGGAGSMFPILRITIKFALPVACLYLPVPITLRNSEQQRIPFILLSGIVIGPLSIAVWSLALQLRGGDTHTIWHGDPLTGVGGIVAMLFALIVGSLTTLLYVLGLKATHRRWGL